MNKTEIENVEPDSGKTSWRAAADEAVRVAVMQLIASSDSKKAMLERCKKYEDMYAGKVPKKLRVQFNVVLPVYAGMIDTLAADFDEPIELDFKETDPSDYFKAKKIASAFNNVKNSSKPNDRWDLKSRWDKKLALICGRGTLGYYAESDPEYKSVLEVVDYGDAHAQPAGGGLLENHLFAGQENVLRTEEDLLKGAKEGIYNKEAVKDLISRGGDKDYLNAANENVQTKLNRFKSLGQDPDNDSYVGQRVFNLVKWVLQVKGVRHYLLFDPFTRTPIRFEKLKDVYSGEYMPWTSWATHEDPKVYWNKSYSDDIFPVAESIVALFNQELTNREKKNLGARAYDPSVFKDVAKLDAAQYRPDALVPADTRGGTIEIGKALYRFDTPELKGTVDLIQFIQESTGRDIGVSDISQGAAKDASKKVGVVYQELNSIQKRIGYKAQSYSECWNEVGQRFIQGLKDHMPASMAIKILGPDGYEWDEITRMDLDTKEEIEVQVTSSTYQTAKQNAKKAARVKGIEMISADKTLAGVVNPKKKAEVILRDVAELEDSEIQEFFDMDDYGSQETIALASMAIKDMIRDQKPEFNFDADTKFLQIILDYAKKHRNKLGVKKFKVFTEYIQQHVETATQNMARKAGALKRQNAANNPVKAPAAKPELTTV